jgi:hypothetical protein
MEGTQLPIMGVRPWLSLRQEVAIAQEPPKLNSPLADATTISRRRDLTRRREALCEWLSRPREQAVRPACMPQFAHFVCAICFTALGSTEPPCHIGRHICLRFPIDFSHVSAGTHSRDHYAMVPQTYISTERRPSPPTFFARPLIRPPSLARSWLGRTARVSPRACLYRVWPQSRSSMRYIQ